MKEHPADKAIRQAAEEIAGGRYVPAATEEQEAADGLGLALGMGSAGAAVGEKPRLGDFRDTHDQMLLERHPRVLEALENMRHEVTEAKGHELVEKNCMLRELTAASEKKNRWDGQGRWMGEENEEMRYGQILSPQQFYDRLGKVTGKGKLKLSEHVMFPHQGAKSGLSGIYMRNPLWDGAAERYREGERQEALRMADECNLMMKEAQNLHRLNRVEEAQKKIREITAMTDEARQKYDRAASGSSLAEPEFVRVATVQWPLSTEWMVMEFTEWGTVRKPKFYGWRTALLTMIRCGAIKETDAHKAFPLGQGEAAGWYLQQIFDFKLEGGTIQ
ncbi:MAG: hypothetical protein WBQ94_04275 [Terracidiphilus sp.]